MERYLAQTREWDGGVGVGLVLHQRSAGSNLVDFPGEASPPSLWSRGGWGCGEEES